MGTIDRAKAQELTPLEAKCRDLESRCTETVNTLERTNLRLEREMTLHRLTSRMLKESELRFRTFFEHAPFGAAISDPDGRILLANRALSEILGYGAHELENMRFSDFTVTDDVEKEMELFRWLREEVTGHRFKEKRYRRKNGAVIWVNFAATVIAGQKETPEMIIAMVEDISDRKRAEGRIRAAKDDLEKIVAYRTEQIRQCKNRLQAENVILKKELADSQRYGTIIGESPPIKTVISQIERVAPTDASVLIYGESGTGKELVAREIHRHSGRKEMPLIKVNCATIPKDLYESEFFGHVKGAFTGAVKDRIGRFETADGGTIFLDEVGEIPHDLQSKLLRILQEGEYERVGEDRTRKVKVRIIAATNKDLIEEVRARRFRDDLFYRLNVFPISIAPLRNRKSDIALLATHFAGRLSKELNVPCPRLTRANIMDLHAYDWPGNVRELENAIERAMILNRSDDLKFTHIKELFQPGENPPARSMPTPGPGGNVMTEEEVKQFQRQNTVSALAQCRWKIYGNDGAARLLNIKPTTLIERMKRMHLQKPHRLP